MEKMKKQKNKRKNYIIEYYNYSPLLYNSFEEFNILLADFIKEKKNFDCIFIYINNIQNENLKSELIKHSIKTEFINGNQIQKFIDFIKICHKYSPQIVHLHFGTYERIPITIYCIIKGITIFNSFHSLCYKYDSIEDYIKNKGYFKFLILKFYHKFLSIASKAIMCVSEGVYKQVNSFGKISNNYIKRLGINITLPPQELSRQIKRKELNINNQEIAFCNISAIEEIKGIDTILKAINFIKLNNPEIYSNIKFFHLGGSRTICYNQYEENLYKYVKEKGIEEHAIFLGRRSDIESILYAFDFYIHPSKMEAISLAIMEAGAHGLPVIGTNIGGIPEIVKDSKTGFLIQDVNDYKSLAQYIIRLAKDINLRKELSKNIKEFTNENFDQNKNAMNYLKMYFS